MLLRYSEDIKNYMKDVEIKLKVRLFYMHVRSPPDPSFCTAIYVYELLKLCVDLSSY